MNATQELKNEHRLIWGVIDAAERTGQAIRKTHTVNRESVEKLIDFFSNFTDACHHAKEEEQLFVKLAAHGFTGDKPPVSVLLQEHAYGRQIMRNIAGHLDSAVSGDTGAAAEIAANLLTYTDMLRAHINKEDQVVFPLSDNLLSAEEQEVLVEEFERIETDKMGEGVHEKYHRIAEELIQME